MYKNYPGVERGSREYVERHRDEFLPGVEIVDELPEGWHVDNGALTAPTGSKWISNGGSLFWRTNGRKRYESALLYTGI